MTMRGRGYDKYKEIALLQCFGCKMPLNVSLSEKKFKNIAFAIVHTMP